MRVCFRADASLQIGSGHVMRCLTLADALAANGAECQFICREHPGNLIGMIRSKGYAVHVLPMLTSTPGYHAGPAHAGWLGASQQQDVDACAPLLAAWQPDWLVVDHYGLDASWERALAGFCRRLMVVDDLADRPHCCDVLLDQTLGRAASDYRALVGAECTLLCGSPYALLRPEFAALRSYSLQRRATVSLQQILITMGGVDKDNVTGQVLQALSLCDLPHDCVLTVVMGETAPWLAQVRQQAQGMAWPTRVLAGVNNMAQWMADSDLAIGAAGATAWERCCLGLPTVMIVLADNQRLVAARLAQAGAATCVLPASGTPDWLNEALTPLVTASVLQNMATVAAGITDGGGAGRVIDMMRRQDA